MEGYKKKALAVAANVLRYKKRSSEALYERLLEKGIDSEDAEYAVNRHSGAGNTLMRKGGGTFNEAGGKSVTVLKHEISQRRQGLTDKGSDISRSS